MASTAAPAGYSKTQIRLHWLVFILIAFQIIGHEWMVDAYDAIMDGEAPETFDLVMAWGHVVSGLIIWVFAAWRLVLRFTRGVPALPPTLSRLDVIASKVVHVVLYGLLLAMPVSGSLAWFLGIEAAADGHSNARFILLPAILLHIAGALMQHYRWKTDVLKRMMRAET
jgi:cytochrome b561